MTSKEQLRRHFLKLRSETNTSKRDNKAIHDNLFNSEYFKAAKTIFTFFSVNNEIDTTGIILKALEDKKNVAIPRVKRRPVMDFVLIDGLTGLKISRFGIPEPPFDEDKVAISDKNTLIIVPGIVFDERKFRIGYGGGFYDYFLSRSVFLKTVGLCYDFQIVKELPAEKFDVPVDIIITEKGIL